MARESYVETCLGRMRRWMALRGLAPNSVSTYVFNSVDPATEQWRAPGRDGPGGVPTSCACNRWAQKLKITLPIRPCSEPRVTPASRCSA
jgi:hypothetical protein